MSDTIRHSIMDNLVTRFTAANAASGLSVVYQTVEDWRLYPLDPVTDVPAIILMDMTGAVVHSDNIITDYDMELIIAIFAKGNETGPQLRNMIADAYTVIGQDLTCGDLVDEIKPVSETISMQQKDNVYGDVEVKFSVKFSTGAFNPTKNYS